MMIRSWVSGRGRLTQYRTIQYREWSIEYTVQYHTSISGIIHPLATNIFQQTTRKISILPWNWTGYHTTKGFTNTHSQYRTRGWNYIRNPIHVCERMCGSDTSGVKKTTRTQPIYPILSYPILLYSSNPNPTNRVSYPIQSRSSRNSQTRKTKGSPFHVWQTIIDRYHENEIT